MCLLDGAAGPALVAALGWGTPPPNVLAVQLLELGRMHHHVADEVRINGTCLARTVDIFIGRV